MQDAVPSESDPFRFGVIASFARSGEECRDKARSAELMQQIAPVVVRLRGR
jgi:hypothetical protein